MKTKKIISSIMALTAVAVLSSCGKDKPSSNDSKPTSESSQFFVLLFGYERISNRGMGKKTNNKFITLM